MKHLIYSFTTSITLLCGVILLSSATNPMEAQTQSMTSVPSPKIPIKVTFADQTYDLDRIDLYERLDRELTAMSYTHGTTLLMLKRANRLFPEIIPILKKNGVPEDLIYLCTIESSLNPRAYSPAKAAGLWQFIPSTAKSYGLEVNEYVDERYNTELATAAAARMLKKLYNQYGNWESAAAAYNGGPARITKELDAQMADDALDLYLVEETQRYMFRILAAKLIFSDPRAYGFTLSADQFYTPIAYTTEKVDTPVESWPQWAEDHGISYAQLRDANPWIRDKTLPNKTGKTYTVKIPTKESLKRSTASKTIYNPKWATPTR